MAKDKLTPKQKAFIRAYKTNGGNAAQAAIEAGYSKKCAKEIGCENLTKLNLLEEAKLQEEELQEKYNYTVDDMVRELDEVKAKADAENNRNAQLKAIELKGKAFGLFVNKVDSRTTLQGIEQALVKWK